MFRKLLILGLLTAAELQGISQSSIFQDGVFSPGALVEELSTDQWLIENELIDINSADSAELVKSGWFSPDIAAEIVSYRHEFGPFVSTVELQVMESIDSEYLSIILPLLTAGKSANYQSNKGYILFNAERILEESKGYIDSLYDRNRWKRTFRMSSRKAGNYSLGLGLSSNAGERYWPDDYAFHLSKEWASIKVLLGDFRMRTGEGLVFGSSFGRGKHPDMITSLRFRRSGIIPNNSVVSPERLRGISLSSRLGSQIEITTFISNQLKDATIYPDANSDYFYSFSSSGNHRTLAERKRWNTVRERALGFSAQWHGKSVSGGLNFIYNNLSKPRKQTYPLTQERLANSNSNSSIYLRKTWQNFYFFSEVAFDSHRQFALIGGSIIHLARDSRLILIGRNYDRLFESILGSGFSEYSGQRNESGLYFGLTLRPYDVLKLNFYYDLFQSATPRKTLDQLSTGSELYFSIGWELSESEFLKLQYRRQSREENTDHTVLPQVGIRSSQHYQVKFTSKPNRLTELRAWISGNFNSFDTKGIYLSFESIHKLGKWTLSNRISQFDIDDWQNRIYHYERDLLYNFSIPSFYNRGVRWYMLGTYKLSKLSIRCKFGRLIYKNKTEVGSGNDLIPGNVKSEIKFQLIYSLNR